MYINEFGNPSDPKLLCLHPMSITGEDLYRTLVPDLAGKYFIIAPDQGGHGKSGPYISLEDETDTLKKYLKENGYTDFALLYGASMGVTAAYELLKDPSLHFAKVWFDGAGFTEKVTRFNGAVTAVFRIALRFCKKYPGLLSRSFSKNYGPGFGEIMTGNFMKLGVEDIIKVFGVFSCSNMGNIPEEIQNRMHLEWGDGDRNYGNSRATVAKYLPHAHIVLREGYGHCGYMAFNTAQYVRELEGFIGVQC